MWTKNCVSPPNSKFLNCLKGEDDMTNGRSTPKLWDIIPGTSFISNDYFQPETPKVSTLFSFAHNKKNGWKGVIGACHSQDPDKLLKTVRASPFVEALMCEREVLIGKDTRHIDRFHQYEKGGRLLERYSPPKGDTEARVQFFLEWEQFPSRMSFERFLTEGCQRNPAEVHPYECVILGMRHKRTIKRRKLGLKPIKYNQ